MEKDIQEIIRTVAQRYGLEYDLHSEQATVVQRDGSVKVLEHDDLVSVFNVSIDKQNWIEDLQIEVKWSSNRFEFELGEDLSCEIRVSPAVA